jgi:uncharacterized protein (TIRG00374 family)
MGSKYRGALVALRIIVSVGLLALLVWRASPGAIWQRWQGLSAPLLALTILIQIAGHALSTAKWGLVLRAQGHRQPYWWLLRTYMVGQFANNFLPTTVGGDAVRAAQLGPRVGSYAHAAASVLLERITGLWALSVLGSLGLLAGAADPPLPLALLVLASAVVTTLVLLATGRAGLATRLIERLPLPAALRRGALALVEALQSAARAPGAMLAVLALSLGFQLLWIGMHVVAGAALGLAVPPLLYGFMVPLTDILGLVPLFFNNLGVREGVFSFFLGRIGIPAASAIALAVLIFSIRLVVSGVGGVILLLGGVQQARKVLQPAQPAAER